MISAAASHLPAARHAERLYALTRRIRTVRTILARLGGNHRQDADGDRKTGGAAGDLSTASMYHNASLL